MSVRLDITTENGKHFTLRRQRQAKRGVTNPAVDEDYEEIRTVEDETGVFPASDYDDVVNTLLPEGISRFFLFDGELLNEYEELVHEGGEHQARAVKQAIELILGVPAATWGRKDLSALKEETDRKYRREASKDAASAGMRSNSSISLMTATVSKPIAVNLQCS